jgi:hypothetical protein
MLAGFCSDCLILGAIGEDGQVVLLTTGAEISNASQVS